jgi:hypothetical protein
MTGHAERSKCDLESPSSSILELYTYAFQRPFTAYNHTTQLLFAAAPSEQTPCNSADVPTTPNGSSWLPRASPVPAFHAPSADPAGIPYADSGVPTASKSGPPGASAVGLCRYQGSSGARRSGHGILLIGGGLVPPGSGRALRDGFGVLIIGWVLPC